jgi:hypothetical protein
MFSVVFSFFFLGLEQRKLTLDREETVVVREKGAEGINRASIERGVDLIRVSVSK